MTGAFSLQGEGCHVKLSSILQRIFACSEYEEGTGCNAKKCIMYFRGMTMIEVTQGRGLTE